MKTSIDKVVNVLLVAYLLSACTKYVGNTPIESSLDNSDVNPSLSNIVHEAKFYSGVIPYEGQSTSMVIYTSENGRFYYLLSVEPLGNLSGQSRAEEVAKRLDIYTIEEINRLSWGTKSNQNIICAYTEAKPNECQLVIAIPKDRDPEEVLVLLQWILQSPGDQKCVAPVKI